MDALAFGARTFTAKSVTPQRAIQVTPVWSSLSVRSRMASRMSLNVDRVDRQGAHTEARNTIPWNLLTQRASKFTTPTQLIRGIMWDLDLFGNAVLWKEKDPSTGRLIGLRYLQGRRLQIKIIDDEKHIIMDGKRDFTSKDVIHFFGTSMDGFRGLSPIKENKNVIAVAMCLEELQGRLYQNGIFDPTLLIPSKDFADDRTGPKMAKELQAAFAGTGNAGKILPLRADFKIERLSSVSPAEQQWQLVQEECQRQIASIWNLPVSFINGKSGDSLTYSTRLQEAQALLDSLDPELRIIEETLSQDEDLMAATKGTLGVTFDRDEVLALNRSERYALYGGAAGAVGLWMTAKEARKEEGLEEREIGDDDILIPKGVRVTVADPKFENPAIAWGSSGEDSVTDESEGLDTVNA